jgi:hypothetical protein
MFQRLMPLAFVNVAVHLLGLLFAAFGMRPGSPLTPLSERVNYLARHPLGWSFGWAVWMLCDVAVVAFIVLAARRVRNDWALLAAGLVLIGTAFDLACDSLFLIVMPNLAAWQPVNEDIFLTVEKIVNTMSLVIANGLITLSTATMTVALWVGGKSSLQSPIILLGAAILIFGLSLSAAAFLSSPWLTEWMTGPTIISYCVWCFLVANRLDRLEPSR